MKKLKLDTYEKELLRAYESGTTDSVPDFEAQKKYFQSAAQLALRKNRNINIRVSENDLFKIKSLAAERGLPYQTLLSSLIHQYSSGRLKLETM